MNRRKIQKTGVATFTVSLPKSWVVRNGLKPGDSVSIYEEDDQNLKIIVKQKTDLLQEAVLDISNFKNETEVIRKYKAHYVNGISKISIISPESFSHESIKIILEQVKKTIGFEIVEETDKKIIIQDFFTSNYLSLQKVILRMYKLSLLIIQESVKILNNQTDKLDNIQLWEEEVNKLYLLGRRQINFALGNSIVLKQLKINVRECQDFLILIGSIEKMADSFIRVAEHCLLVQTIPPKILEGINNKFKEIIEAYENAYTSIVKKDFAKANDAIYRCEKIQRGSINLESQKIPERQKVALYVILSKLQSKTNIINEIAEIGLDMS